jgi:hypothetical protein
MQLAGYATNPEDGAGDQVQPEAPNGQWMNSMNLTAAFYYMKLALNLPNASVQFVHPELLKSFMEVHLKGCPEDGDVLEFGAIQERRKGLLQKLLQSKAVVLVPIHHLDHWALLAVDGRDEANRTFFWRDSLTPGDTTAGVKAYVDGAMKELTGWEVPAACNAALQPVGTAVCGCFVLHWMEQACRSLVLNEAGCSIGWPKSEVWAGRVVKLVELMEKEQKKLKKEHEASVLKAFADNAKKKAAEAAKGSAASTSAAIEGLKGDASTLATKVPAGKPCLENLSPVAQSAVLKASLGSGVCSKCHWQSGCYMCTGAKALQYWLKKEGFTVDTIAYAVPK